MKAVRAFVSNSFTNRIADLRSHWASAWRSHERENSTRVISWRDTPNLHLSFIEISIFACVMSLLSASDGVVCPSRLLRRRNRRRPCPSGADDGVPMVVFLRQLQKGRRGLNSHRAH